MEAADLTSIRPPANGSSSAEQAPPSGKVAQGGLGGNTPSLAKTSIRASSKIPLPPMACPVHGFV